MKYQLIKNYITSETDVVNRIEENSIVSIPFDPQNSDYAQFKKDILDGAELVDADGQAMQDAIQFVKELP